MMLSGCEFQGFPIVSSLQEMHLVGYAGNPELLYAIRQAKHKTMSGSSSCLFLEPSDITELTKALDLRPWMDRTPFTLHPRYPISLVLEMFKKLGLRYVLITKRGKLCGIITKKDLLRHLQFIKEPIKYAETEFRETG